MTYPNSSMMNPLKEQADMRMWLQSQEAKYAVDQLRALLQDYPWELKNLGMQHFWVQYKKYLRSYVQRDKNFGELKRLLLMVPDIEIRGQHCGLKGKDVDYWQKGFALPPNAAPSTTAFIPSLYKTSSEAKQWLETSEGKNAISSLLVDLEKAPLNLPSVGGLTFWVKYKEHLARDYKRARYNGEMKTVLALVPSVLIRGDVCGLADAGPEYWERCGSSAEPRDVFSSEDQCNYIGEAHIKPSADFLGGAVVTLTNCQNRIGETTTDISFIVEDEKSSGLQDGSLAVARKTVQGKILYKGVMLPIQVLKWNGLVEGSGGISALEYFSKKSKGDLIDIDIKYQPMLNRIIIEDGHIAVTGFLLDPKQRKLVVDDLRMTDDWNSVVQELAGVCWAQYIGKNTRVLIPKSAETPTGLILGEEYFDKPLLAPINGNNGSLNGTNDGEETAVPVTFSDGPAPVAVLRSGSVIDPSKVLGTGVEWESTEKAFLENFFQYIELCEFKYDRRDIIRFHTSLKAGWFTILGGDPGVGKSSLVRLYANALAGRKDDEYGVDGGFLRIDVSPAWTEPEDLLGYMDYSKQFVPAANGMYGFLKERTDSLDVIMVCLEEMNLARVEYYFNQFLQMGDNDKEKHLIRVADGKDLILPDGLRFVGTINFDETVQELSPRVYDRCNYLELENVEKDVFSPVRAIVRDYEGEKISLGRYNTWTEVSKGRKIVESTKEAYNQLKELLQPLHLMPSPRVATAMMRYVMIRPALNGETEAVLQLKALDEAIVQRILPKCRRADSQYGKEQMALYNAFESLGLTLSKNYYARLIRW